MDGHLAWESGREYMPVVSGVKGASLGVAGDFSTKRAPSAAIWASLDRLA